MGEKGKEAEKGECDRVVTEGESGAQCVSGLCVCLCARVPRRRQTLAALSELTGPSPLPLLVAQGGREREKEMEDTGGLSNCLCISKHMMSHPLPCTFTLS